MSLPSGVPARFRFGVKIVRAHGGGGPLGRCLRSRQKHSVVVFQGHSQQPGPSIQAVQAVQQMEETEENGEEGKET